MSYIGNIKSLIIMFYDENDHIESNIFNKINCNDSNILENQSGSYENNENFQDSFVHTFNEQLYNERYNLSEPALYFDNLDNKNHTTLNQFANQNDSFSTLSSSMSSHQPKIEESVENLRFIDQEKPLYQLGGKRGRPMTDKCLIIDETTKKIYDPDIDPEEYRKARKRIQNRESAVRSRIKKKENDKHFSAELDFLRKENDRLNLENSNLKKERAFFCDQINFLKSLIIKESKNKNIDNKSIGPKNENITIDKNTIDSDTNNSNNSEDIEKNTIVNKYPRGALFGTNKKNMNKLFMIGVLCIISLVYVSMNVNSDNGTISFSNEYTITTNENYQTLSKTNHSNGKIYAFVLTLIIIFLLFYKFHHYFSKKIDFLKAKFLKNS